MTDNLPTAPTRGKWPGIAGITHDGDVYCVDCALEMDLITTAPDSDHATYKAMVDGDPVNFRDAPWTGVMLSDSEADVQLVCGRHKGCVHSENGEMVELDHKVINYE